MRDGCAQVKWQVMLQEAAPMEGACGVWADLQPEWAEECEEVYDIIKDWTDLMWTWARDVDAPPQVNSNGKLHSFYVIEFHNVSKPLIPTTRSLQM